MKFFKKDIDPSADVEMLQDAILADCDDMVLYENIYFSKDAFVKQIYIGANGVFLVIPLLNDDLDMNIEEQKRCVKVLIEIKEAIEVQCYIYPVFVGNEKFYFAPYPNKPVEIITCEFNTFIETLYKYTMENKVTPIEVIYQVDKIIDYVPTGDKFINTLDNGTIERVLGIVYPMENNNRPDGITKYDEYGTEYVLKPSDVKIGRINTGLIGKKEWYRVADYDTEKLMKYALFGGCFGLHKIMTGERMQFILYLLTCGCCGLLPTVDILAMFRGNYTYKDIGYTEQEEEIVRHNKCRIKHSILQSAETVYFKKCKGFFKGIVCTVSSLVIGIIEAKFIYTPILLLLMKGLSEAGIFIANSIKGIV